MTYQPINPIGTFNGVTYYGAAKINTDEEARQALIDSWTTPEQRKFNAWRRENTHECPRCRGRGYTRKDKNTGCTTCKGVGYVVDGEPYTP